MVKKSMHIKKKHHKNSKKNKKGGFLFSKSTLPEICNVTNVDDLKTSAELNTRYQTCCPKTFLGFKNKSPLCTNIQNKLDEFAKGEYSSFSDSNQLSSVSSNVSEVPVVSPESSQQLPIAPTSAPTKPWYQFWGGKKYRHNKKSKHHKRHSKKNKKTKKNRKH